MQFKVTYKRGLGKDRIVEADSIEMAKRMGLVEYRKNTGNVEYVDLKPVDKVVEKVEQL